MTLARSKYVRLLLVGLVLLCGSWSSRHSAAAAPSGITISPAFQQVSIPLGAASQPLKFTIINHEQTAQTIRLSTQDFNTLSETGGLVFVGSNPTQLQKKYGLAKWLSLDQSQVTVPPGATTTVNAKILNLPTLAPGGHYGALMLSLSNGSSSGNNISIHPIASSLLFVTKIGGDTHQLSLAGVNDDHTLFKLPGNVVLRFQNIGNTHIVPRGLVRLVDSNGSLISKGIINQDSAIILPQTFRQLNVPLHAVSTASGLGKYKLIVDFRFDGFNHFRRYQTGMTYFPAPAVIAIIFLITVLIAALLLARRRMTKKSKTNN